MFSPGLRPPYPFCPKIRIESSHELTQGSSRQAAFCSIVPRRAHRFTRRFHCSSLFHERSFFDRGRSPSNFPSLTWAATTCPACPEHSEGSEDEGRPGGAWPSRRPIPFSCPKLGCAFGGSRSRRPRLSGAPAEGPRCALLRRASGVEGGASKWRRGCYDRISSKLCNSWTPMQAMHTSFP
jgi:hypothetical protein